MIAGIRVFYDLQPIHNVDEGVLAAAGDIIIHGGIPYRDIWCHRGPLSHGFYALVFFSFGTYNMTAIHLVATLLTFLAIFLLYLIAKEIAPKNVAWGAALFFAIFSTVLFEAHDSLATNSEVIMNPLLLLGVLCFVKNMKKTGVVTLPLAGLFTGIAFLIKQTAIINIFIFFLFILLWNKNGLKKGVISSFILGLFSLIPFLTILIFYYLIGSIDDFIFLFFKYNAIYLRENTITAFCGSFLLFLVQLFSQGWLLVSALIVYILSLSKKNYFSLVISQKSYFLILCWFLITFVFISLPGRFFGHYYLQCLPPLCIIAAIIFVPLIISSNSFLQNTAKSIVFLGISIPVLLTVVNPYLQFILNDYKVKGCVNLNEIFRPSQEHQELVDFIQTHTDYHNKIFIWGIYPELYVLSKRSPASRFVFPSFLVGLIPWVNVGSEINTDKKIIPGAWEKLEVDLRKAKPKLIIDASYNNRYWFGKYPLEKYKVLRDLISQKYRLVNIIKGCKMYLRVKSF